jgi:BirA family transcriptional regulator, biotin operon repressor / biotin---[acetyl-CoA-carboxylase] ligase
MIERLDALLPGVRVERVEAIGSTNTALIERIRSGDTLPTLLVARHQTAGRGRQGKAWWSAPDASLTFSLALPYAPRDWSGLSLALGLALAQALDPAGTRLQLKWPNDLWLCDSGGARKLGGILIETVGAADGARHAVIGIGLNIAPGDAEPADARFGSGHACVRELIDNATPDRTLLRAAPAVWQALQVFALQGFAPLRDGYARRDALAGHPVQATAADGVVQGRAAGVDERGRLLVHTDLGMKTIESSEVSVRPC